MFEDSTFWLFVAPGLLLGLYAQARIKANYVRYSRVGTSGGIAGAQVARALLDARGLQRVQIESTAISANFGNDPVDAEKARLRLAEALLSIDDGDSRDVEVLKRAALQRMALDYKRRR